jgi:hypothetical protein
MRAVRQNVAVAMAVVAVATWLGSASSAAPRTGPGQTDPARGHTVQASTWVQLVRQPVWEGPIPYVATFPALGSIPDGRLQWMELPGPDLGNFELRFMKAGRSTAECGNPAAVVTLRPGHCLMASELAALYGSSAPSLPITFVACVGASAASAPDSVLIRVAYTYTTRD